MRVCEAWPTRLREDLSFLSRFLHCGRIARSIFNALRLARRDELEHGFDTPMPSRRTKTAPGAPNVMAKHPSARPLHHDQVVGDVRFQAYRLGHRVVLLSDDAGMTIERTETDYLAECDGRPVVCCDLQRRFASDSEAMAAAVEDRQRRDAIGNQTSD
jgi:hypothetical protein